MMQTMRAKLAAAPLAKSVDAVWVTVVLIPLFLAIAVPNQLVPTLDFALRSFAKTSIFIGIAVLLTGWLRAANLESTISLIFRRRKAAMTVLAALVGGLSPFCSCEVIPFVAALLAAGAPLAPVMAFWLSSPLIDPPMFLITGSILGFDFAVAKTLAAVLIGLAGGAIVAAIESFGFLTRTLRADAPMANCCGSSQLGGQISWRFWTDAERRGIFRATAIENALFLGKWLLLAYILQSLMVAWIPPEWIAATLGGEGLSSVMLGALAGIPAYLNGYAAVPLVDGLLQQGMSQATAMTFMIAGGITCVPAALAVWALARKPVFLLYILLALAGSIAAGLLWGLAA